MSPSNGIIINNNNNNNNGVVKNYIEHQVSKFDTLAGIAIKYGVEVADIKRLNWLATDLQMFALKTLQIPSPGRHPPSSSLSNGSASPGKDEGTPLRSGPSNMFEAFQPLRIKSTQNKVSPAMSNLQKYYSLPEPKEAVGETEMVVYKRGSSESLSEGLLPKSALLSDMYSDHYQKSRNLGNGFRYENGADAADADAGDADNTKSNEKSVRRRSKAEVDSSTGLAEWLLKDEYGSGSSSVSSVTGKSLASRPPKSVSRTATATDSDSLWLNTLPVGLGDSIIADGVVGVRKSSSTPSFQDQDNGNSFVWPVSKWSLKPDLQALSTGAITIPIFDGLPNPITGRKSKAALD